MIHRLLERKEDILFYDVEVFEHNSMAVFKNWEGKTVRVFSSSLNGLGELFDKGLIKGEGYDGLEEYVNGKTLIGYNNYFYDDYIIYAMSKGLSQDIIKSWNDSLILKKSKLNMKKIEGCYTLDTFQQIDVSNPGLKKIEGNLGVSIIESSVDFKLDRPLTPQENYETFRYCEYDVAKTITIFKMRLTYFQSKGDLIEMLPEERWEKVYKWNTTTIIGELLAPKSKPPGKLYVPEEMLELVPKDVQDMWRQVLTSQDYKFSVTKVIEQVGDLVIEFGWGGLHGSTVGVGDFKNVMLYDVRSMYPSIIILLEGLGDKTEMYKQILEKRLELKKKGLKREQEVLKLILNSTYGLLNNQYNVLNNPPMAYSVCIYGQISLYVLTMKLIEVGCKVFNVNTDGVAFVPDRDGQYKHIVEEWEEQFKLDLDLDKFDRWIQKDVNNYIALTDDGKIKTKGGDTNMFTDHEEGGVNYYFKTANIRIVQKALVEKLLNNKPVAETVWENRDKPELYQYILQAGHTYEGTVDNQGNLLQKVNRVFASKVDSTELFKKRMDGGLVKFADAPPKMRIWNGEVADVEDFEKLIDFDWYVKLTEKKLKQWA